MKIDTRIIIKDAFGEPIIDGQKIQCTECGKVFGDGKELTLGKAIYYSLSHSDQKENIKEEDAYKRHLLSMKIAKEGLVEIDAVEDVKLIRELSNKRFGPLVYGIIRDLIDPDKQKKKGAKK